MSVATSDLPRFVVPRPALVRRLDQAVSGRLTSIVAPPGFGKSTLLHQWASPRRPLIAWLSLDRRDNDGRRLARRLLDALTHLDADMGVAALELVEASGDAMGEQLLARALDALERAEPGVLVIDGLDAIISAPLLLDLHALIRHAPPPLSIVVATRVEPDQPWTDEPTTHLGHQDLAFSPEHAALLVSTLSNRVLSPSQIEELVAKTEGWPVGLQLFGLSLRDGADVDELIERYSGAGELVGGYLTDEVLDRQPESVRRFLVQTSILRRLSGPLCEALLEDQGGEEMLRAVAQRSIFLVPVDGSDEWFRYHGLFQDLTRHELRARMPEAEPELLRAAADWHLTRGALSPAMEYLIDARDWERVLDLVRLHGQPMCEHGDIALVLHWLDQVPTRVRRARSDLVLTEAILRSMVGTTVLAEDLVDHLLQAGSPTPAEVAIANMLRATWVRHHATPGASIAAADAALATLDDPAAEPIHDLLGVTAPHHMRYVALTSRARGKWYQGDVDEARAELAEVVDRPFDYAPWRVSALGSLGLVDAWAGRLHDGNEAAVRALVVASQHDLLDHPCTTDALLAMASICRERDQLGRAELLLDQAIVFATPVQRFVVIAVHAVERASVDLALGDPDRGLDRLRSLAASGHPTPARLIAERLRAVEARLRVATGDIAGARRLVETAPRPLAAPLAAVAVQVAVRSGDQDGARAALATWAAEGLRSQVEHELWSAIVEEGEAAGTPARRHLVRAVALAESEEHLRVFHDAGPEAMRLLRGLQRARPTPYLERILASASRSSSATASEDRLSPRELAVLRYLPSQLSNAELADALYVSQNTVKSHLRSIYRRLDVSGRRAAVAEAERRGLL